MSTLIRPPQLYASAHTLWAELTNKGSLNELNTLSQARGKGGITDNSAQISQHTPQALSHLITAFSPIFNNTNSVTPSPDENAAAIIASSQSADINQSDTPPQLVNCVIL